MTSRENSRERVRPAEGREGSHSRASALNLLRENARETERSRGRRGEENDGSGVPTSVQEQSDRSSSYGVDVEEILRPLRERRFSRDRMRAQIKDLDEKEARAVHEAWIEKHYPDKGGARTTEIYDMNLQLRFQSRDRMCAQIKDLDEKEARAVYETWIEKHYPDNDRDKQRARIVMDTDLRKVSFNRMLDQTEGLDDMQASLTYQTWIDKYTPDASNLRLKHLRAKVIRFAPQERLDELLKRNQVAIRNEVEAKFTNMEKTLLENACEVGDEMLGNLNVEAEYIYMDQKATMIAAIMTGGDTEKLTFEEKQSDTYKDLRDSFYTAWRKKNRNYDVDSWYPPESVSKRE